MAIGTSSHLIYAFLDHDPLLDTMAEKKQLCLDLGSETWIDFKTKDLVKANRKRATKSDLTLRS